MLRIAVPNKGSLSAPAMTMLHDAGYPIRTDAKELVLIDEQNQIEFFYLRPRDIAVYVGSGRLDVGITGRDLLIDSAAAAEEILSLGFARSTFYFAGEPGAATSVSDLAGASIATSYPGIVAKYLAEHGVQPGQIVRLDGAVETSLRLGVAHVIADVVETGTTLARLGLTTIGEPIMTSEAVVIRPHAPRPGADEATQRFVRRLRSVQVARDFVMIDYDVPEAALDQAVEITPGLESPTVAPLHREGWLAVRALVPTGQTQPVMDALEAIGARAILATPIRAFRH